MTTLYIGLPSCTSAVEPCEVGASHESVIRCLQCEPFSMHSKQNKRIAIVSNVIHAIPFIVKTIESSMYLIWIHAIVYVLVYFCLYTHFRTRTFHCNEIWVLANVQQFQVIDRNHFSFIGNILRRSIHLYFYLHQLDNVKTTNTVAS